MQPNGAKQGGNRVEPAGATAMRQKSAAMISQQKGVVHTANQASSARSNETLGANNQNTNGAMDPGSGSGGASVSTSTNMQVSGSRHQSEINAESGSTALTNQTKYLSNSITQPATQNQ